MVIKAQLVSRTSFLAALLFTAMLGGCTSGTMSGLPADYVVEQELGKGVIVGSVGSQTFPDMAYREWNTYAYRSKADPKQGGFITSAVKWSNPFYPQPECPDDGLEDECGLLFAMDLPVGKYEIFGVIPARDSQSANGWGGWDASIAGYDFEVKPGQATYIGNLLSRICAGSSYSYYGIARVGTGRSAMGNVADMYDRDVPLLMEKFSQLKTTTINNETMAGQPWLWEYKQPNDEVLPVVLPNKCMPDRHLEYEGELRRH